MPLPVADSNARASGSDWWPARRSSARALWVRLSPPSPAFTVTGYAWSGCFAWALLATADLLVGGQVHGAKAVVSVASTAAVVGFTQGLAAGLVLRTLHGARLSVRVLVAVALASLTTWWLARALNVPQALNARDSALAWLALAASTASAASLALAGLALVPSAGWPRGFAAGLT